MGKSNKKIKPDRLNALRKQYDFFLEEDKKRKERNEYILGKLDKMVYSNALVPARIKQTPIVNTPSATYHLAYQPDVPVAYARPPPSVIQQQLTQDISVKNIDDSYLIKEISKKYILIPKHTSPFMNTNIQQTQSVYNGAITEDFNPLKTSHAQQPSSIENNDWKSKYEILNILKKDETENTSPFASSSTEALLYSTTNKDFTNGGNIMNENMPHKTDYRELSELPEKDISEENINYKLGINDDISNSATRSQIQDPIVHVNADNNVSDEVANIGYDLQKTTLIDCNQIETNETNPSIDENSYIEHTNEYDHIDPGDRAQQGEQIHYEKHPSDGDTFVTPAEYNYTETSVPLPADEQIHYDKHPSDGDTVVTPAEYNYTEPIVPLPTGDQIHYETNPLVGDTTITPAEYNYTEPIAPLSDEQIHYAEHFEPVHGTDAVVEENIVEEKNDVIQSPEVESLSQQYKSRTLEEQLYTENQDAESVQVISSNELMEGNYYNQTIDDNGAKDFVDQEPIYTGVDNLPSNTDFYMKSPHENIEQGIPSETVGRHDEEAVNTASVQDLDAEQREMVYSEHQVDAYGYQQDGAYNQETYQNEGYPQKSDYYDENLQQQVYTNDAKEDEQHLNYEYDQSYPQEYVPHEKAYAEEQPEYQNSEPIEPEQVELVNDDQPWDKPNQIVAATDNEEGYIESTATEVVSSANDTPAATPAAKA